MVAAELNAEARGPQACWEGGVVPHCRGMSIGVCMSTGGLGSASGVSETTKPEVRREGPAGARGTRRTQRDQSGREGREGPRRILDGAASSSLPRGHSKRNGVGGRRGPVFVTNSGFFLQIRIDPSRPDWSFSSLVFGLSAMVGEAV